MRPHAVYAAPETRSARSPSRHERSDTHRARPAAARHARSGSGPQPPSEAELDALTEVARWSGSSRTASRGVHRRPVAGRHRAHPRSGPALDPPLRTAPIGIATRYPAIRGSEDAVDEGRAADRLLVAAECSASARVIAGSVRARPLAAELLDLGRPLGSGRRSWSVTRRRRRCSNRRLARLACRRGDRSWTSAGLGLIGVTPTRRVTVRQLRVRRHARVASRGACQATWRCRCRRGMEMEFLAEQEPPPGAGARDRSSRAVHATGSPREELTNFDRSGRRPEASASTIASSAGRVGRGPDSRPSSRLMARSTPRPTAAGSRVPRKTTLPVFEVRLDVLAAERRV